MKTFKTYRAKDVNEIGFSGRPVRNVDPIQYMIRGILSGDMKLNLIDKQPDTIKKRILRDLKDITTGKLPLWMPKKYKLPKKREKDLITQLRSYK